MGIKMIEKLQNTDLNMKVSNPLHYGRSERKVGKERFTDVLSYQINQKIEKVNNLQIASDKLTEKMTLQPDSVNVHEVMIAAQKAQLSLDLTKNVLNRAVQAFQTISNLR